MKHHQQLICLVLILLAHPFSVPAILDPVDFLALQAIQKSLQDLPGSLFFAGWDFTADPCSFNGVFCSDERVVALSLGDPRAGSPGLTGTLDGDALGRLSALAELSIVPGRISGPIPSSLALCTNLRFLALSRNLFSGSIPDSLSSLPSLRTLDLSYNQLTGSIPQSLPQIPSLTNLALCHNKLSGSIPPFSPDALANNLIRLDLKHNNLTGSIPPLPTSLQYLSLSWNSLTGPIDGVLPQLNQLNYLDLSMNQLTGPIPGILFTFPLASLQLQKNFFVGRVMPEVTDVMIPVVDLSFNRLGGAVPPQLASVGRLYLNNNRFTGEVPSKIVQGLNSKMQLLYLQHNFLTGFEIGPAAVSIPVGASLCLQFNCMVPPPNMPCPVKAGMQRTRPTEQCPEWRD